MKKKRGKIKALIIGAGISLGIIVLRVLLFESILMQDCQLKDFPIADKYKQYILFQKEFREWSPSFLSSGGRWVKYEYDFMLQGQYHELLDAITKDIYEELDSLVKDYSSVSHYEVDVKSKIIIVYYYQNPQGTEETDFDGKYLHERVENKLECLYELWCIFSKSDKNRYDIESMVYLENTYYDTK